MQTQSRMCKKQKDTSSHDTSQSQQIFFLCHQQHTTQQHNTINAKVLADRLYFVCHDIMGHLTAYLYGIQTRMRLSVAGGCEDVKV